MLRAAAKNHESVLVVVDPADYALVLARAGSARRRHQLRHCARAWPPRPSRTPPRYDTMVADYLAAPARVAAERFPADAAAGLRQGAGPALRREPAPAGGVLPRPGGARRRRRPCPRAAGQGPVVQQHRRRRHRDRVRAAVRGAAPASSSSTPIRAAWRSAPARSRPTSAPTAPIRPRPSAASSPSTASSMPPPPRPSPSASSSRCWPRPPCPRPPLPSARGQAQRAGAGARATWRRRRAGELELRSVTGGLLVQTRDLGDRAAGRAAGRHAPAADRGGAAPTCASPGASCKFVKSNAIVFARDGATVGVGAGQMSRVYSTRIAAMKAADEGLERRGRGHGLGRVLPVPRRPRRRRRIRHPRRHPARRLACATPRSSPRPTSTAWPWCSPACATSATSHEGPDRRRRRPRARAGVEVRRGRARHRSAGGARQRRHRHRAQGAQRRRRGRGHRRAGAPGARPSTSTSPSSGPEAPLVAGVVDAFAAAGLRCFGPTRAARSSRARRPSPRSSCAATASRPRATATFTASQLRSRRGCARQRAPLVVKASGLAAGKGVVIADVGRGSARERAGDVRRTVRRGRPRGRGRGIPRRAKKRASSSWPTARTCCRSRPRRITSACGDGDQGPNTGGMGAYSPAPVVTAGTARAHHARGDRADHTRARGRRACRTPASCMPA